MAGRHDANACATSRAAAKACTWGSVRVPESIKGALTRKVTFWLRPPTRKTCGGTTPTRKTIACASSARRRAAGCSRCCNSITSTRRASLNCAPGSVRHELSADVFGTAAHTVSLARPREVLGWTLSNPPIVAEIKGGKKLDDFLIDKSAQKRRKKRRSKR